MPYDYKIDMTVTANIDSKTVEQMVRDIVESDTGRKIKSLTMRVRSRAEGQVVTQVFDGVSVTFDGDVKAEQKSDGKIPFREDSYQQFTGKQNGKG
jgi:hypothetical protein